MIMKRFFTQLFILKCLAGTGFLMAQDVLFTEGFDYPAGDLPSNWTIDAEQPPEWSINVSQISGGSAPELYMGYGMQVGLSRLISPVIDINGYNKLTIKYKQYLINYAADWGETIGMDVTFDGGTTWQPLWEQPLGLLNIPQDEFAYYVNSPAGATEMQIAFRFEGNNMGINGWAIDDIVVEDSTDNDLLVTKIMGNTTPNAGHESMFMVEVQNGGKLTQENYSIKLMTEEGTELSSLSGESIEFAEKKQYILNWTPTSEQIGMHRIYAGVDLAQDENADNDKSSNVIVNVLASDTQNNSIGNESFPLQHSIPYNFFYNHSLSQSMYLSSWIGEFDETKKISGISYTCMFDEDLEDIPVQIYLAETTQDNLSTDWVDPSTFTLVYEGLMDFQRGLNSMYIPLETPFEYEGGNLVVYSNKSHTEQVLWSTFISSYHEDEIYSRMIDGGENAYDAMNPPQGYNVWYTPNINLFFSSGEMAVIDQQANLASITVYPNPVRDLLHITTQNDEEILEVQLINAVGQIVSKSAVNNKKAEFNVQGLSAGFYLVQVRTSKGVVTKKIQVL